MGARSNPFSACFVRPGAIEWVTGDGEPTIGELTKRIDRPRSWQVLGPHGSGKTTLLSHIARELAARGQAATLVRPTRGDDAWRLLARPCAVLLVDEYESLPRLTRMALRACRWLRRGTLVIACHDDAGFETLARMSPSVDVARRIVASLAGPRFANEAAIDGLIAEHGHDIREVLFALYDAFEKRSDDQPRQRRAP